MAWRIVKQPNGFLAKWSDVVDHFTEYNMTEEEAFELCRIDMGIQESKQKVQAGVDDCPPWKVGVKGNGHERWDDCMESLQFRHGRREANKVKKELSR